MLKKSVILIVCLGIAVGVFFLAGCVPQPELPKEAEEALRTYWRELPAWPSLTHQIVRAWPGSESSDEVNPSPVGMEVWCVEAEMISPGDPSLNGDRLIWILMREEEDENWTAAMLATMSSIWPYEACEERP